ncbi:MAG TPA: DUF2314 domain-containing protein [Armatimonadota bacterium]|nr:DUF2314 domain-containing protein [Armatimonadota bacterium]HOS42732.1 DUF2314 domain-containing protein [Armatimonadota bacterium]
MDFWIAVGVIVLLAVAAALVKQALRRMTARKAAKADDEPMISLVLLRSSRLALTEDDVRARVSRALGTQFDLGNEHATEFVMEMPKEARPPFGEGQTFMVQLNAGLFFVHSYGQPYADLDGRAVDGITDLRLRRIMTDHRAWLSVDLLSAPEGAAREAAYPTIGKILAAMLDAESLGVLAPQLSRCHPLNDDARDALRGDDPLALFSAMPVPILSVAADDPAMTAAIAEARRRWPEFVAAFTARAAETQGFHVKAAFTHGDATEHIWVEVDAIDGETITGSVGNDPENIPGLQYHDRVTVTVERISDWLYFNGQEMVGGFTVKVLTEMISRKT